MKTILIGSLVVFLGLVGVTLAGSGPAVAPAGCHGRVAKGCHGEQMVAVEQGCHGATLLAPAVAAEGGCHGGRITGAERRLARQAARQNASATKAQFRSAARQGSVSAVPVTSPTMQMATACSCEGKCDCR
jgi:hypothetical protein